MILPRFRFRRMLFFVAAATTIGVVSVLAIPLPVGSDASTISTPLESPASTNDVHAPASPQHKAGPVPISLDPGTISAPESPASANVHARPASPRGKSGPGAISAPESLASANVHARPASPRGQSGSGTVSTHESPASEAINVHARPASPQGESGPVPAGLDASRISAHKSPASPIVFLPALLLLKVNLALLPLAWTLVRSPLTSHQRQISMFLPALLLLKVNLALFPLTRTLARLPLPSRQHHLLMFIPGLLLLKSIKLFHWGRANEYSHIWLIVLFH
ncbi:hypothetical protein FB446DRAFT_417400 [Lentinula raphanica]|nr:hypothetical protein FB446DRAFT_417400 [Lentinula raphanica]